MIPDYHLHTNFSGDSKAAPEAVIEQAITLGMPSICVTDHCDTDCEDPKFILDTESYIARMETLRDQYQGKIDLRIGVELGMQTYLAERHRQYVKQYPFDFVIGSLHLVDGLDPYYPEVFEGKEDREVYRRYFESLYENVQVFSDFQVLGHIDYVVRYGVHKAMQYSYQEYADIIDEILRTVIHNGCGIEVNTAGLLKGLGFSHPHPDIIRRYKELGGEIITLGSDAHAPENIGYQFQWAKELIKSFGFDYYAQFQQKVVRFVQI